MSVSASEADGSENVDFSKYEELLTPKMTCLGTWAEQRLASASSEAAQRDGRGVLIAILDTGVDPSLPGLQSTTIGERKIKDLYDCSGAGDVDCSKSVTADGGHIIGLTGRKLKIPEDWVNPTGRYYIGIKPIHELYTKMLKNALKKERKTEVLDSSHNMALADARRLMAAHEEEIGATSTKDVDRYARENLANKIDFLKECEKMEDRGPVADCVMWHDGDEWKGVLDTSFRGRLSLCTPMRSYGKAGEHCTHITEKDQLSYSFQLYGEQKLMEIVTTCGSHGSHVASIAAAHFPDSEGTEKRASGLDGLAPGAQIISLCIGDSRLGSVETGTALTRAFTLCDQLNVNVINLSYGENVDFPDCGRIVEEAKRLLARKGTLFFCSAGNGGPAMSTVGSLGGTTSGIIGVGAALLPEQLSVLYGTNRKAEDVEPFPWSSNGPTVDGDFGVAIYAPGAAFAEIPRCTRKSNQLMNGTSMSSPNAAGAVACLLSALNVSKDTKVSITVEDKEIPLSSFDIRKALEMSATKMPKLLNGAGMLNVPAAYELLCKLAIVPKENTHFPLYHLRINCSRQGIPQKMRGIYMRNAADFDAMPHRWTVSVEPMFQDSADVHQKTSFQHKVQLKWVSSCAHECVPPNVEFPDVVYVTSTDNTFQVLITEQNVDRVAGWIQGTTATQSGIVLFRVPVLMHRPSTENVYQILLEPGVVHRRLLDVPIEANIASIKFRSPALLSQERLMVHALQVVSNKATRSTEFCKAFVTDRPERIFTFPVVPGRSLEVCFAHSSQSHTSASADVEVSFHGLRHDSVLHLTTASSGNRFDLEALSALPMELDPTISLKSIATFYKPTEYVLEPVQKGSCDIMSNDMLVNRITMKYKVTVTAVKGADHQFEIAGLSDYLYESPFDCILIQVFSNTKEYLGASSSFRDRYTIKLDKGEYTVVAQVRHTNEVLLEKLRDATLTVYQRLATPVTLDCLSSAAALSKNKTTKWPSRILSKSQIMSCFVMNVPEDKALKAPAGSQIRGVMTPFGGEWKERYQVPVVLHSVCAESKKLSKALSQVELEEKKEKKEPMVEMKEAMRDLQITHLDKITDNHEAKALFTSLNAEFPDHLPLLAAWTKKSFALMKSGGKARKSFLTHTARILELCKPEEVLMYNGLKNSDHDLTLASQKTSMDKRKEIIIDTLIARCHFMTEMIVDGETTKDRFPKAMKPTAFKKDKPAPEDTESESEAWDQDVSTSRTRTGKKFVFETPTVEDLRKEYRELLKFVAPDDAKVLATTARHAIIMGQHGTAAKMVHKHIVECRSTAKDIQLDEKLLAELCDLNGWDHIATVFRNDHMLRNRSAFRPF